MGARAPKNGEAVRAVNGPLTGIRGVVVNVPAGSVLVRWAELAVQSFPSRTCTGPGRRPMSDRLKLHIEHLDKRYHTGPLWHWVVSCDGDAVGWGWERRRRDAERVGKRALASTSVDSVVPNHG